MTIDAIIGGCFIVVCLIAAVQSRWLTQEHQRSLELKNCHSELVREISEALDLELEDHPGREPQPKETTKDAR